MPKIIENCREKLLDEARRQINECGYGALTIRGVARACGVGVGTVYNYFSSKDALVATFMLEDWQAATADMHKAFGSGMPMEILSAEYDGLVSFAARHRALFMDPAAIAAFSVLPRAWHVRLRKQLAVPLETALAPRANARFLSQFLVESLLTWAQAGVAKDELTAVWQPLLQA